MPQTTGATITPEYIRRNSLWQRAPQHAEQRLAQWQPRALGVAPHDFPRDGNGVLVYHHAQRLPSVVASRARNTSGRRHHEAQQGWEQGLIGEGVLSEAFEALSPSVGGDGGELGKEHGTLGFGRACRVR